MIENGFSCWKRQSSPLQPFSIGPIDVAVLFADMTPEASSAFRRSMAIRGTLVASLILLTFALIGDFLLHSLGISLAALKMAGGGCFC